MTPARLSACLSAIPWTRPALAHALGYRSENTVRQWEQGRAAVPQEVAAWLERAAQWHAENPPPQRAA